MSTNSISNAPHSGRYCRKKLSIHEVIMEKSYMIFLVVCVLRVNYLSISGTT